MKSITIKFSDVFNEVKRTTEYIGQKNEAYDKLRMLDVDDEQMMQWFADGMSHVGIILDRLLSKRIQTSFITGEATMVLNIGNNNQEQVKDCIIRVVSMHMLNAWLEIVAPELLQLYKAEEQQLSQELMQLAYYREMPR